MSLRACIIANSPEFDEAAILKCAERADLVIAVDGAANRLPARVAPHVVCGDFDSIKRDEARARFPSSEFLHVPCQESNDLEKSVVVALERGASEIDVVSACGGLLEQTLTTISVIERYHERASFVLYHGDTRLHVMSSRGELPHSYSIPASDGARVSLIPRHNEAVVTLSNVQWPLRAEPLNPGSRGVSNRALGGAVDVIVHQGSLLFCVASR